MKPRNTKPNRREVIAGAGAVAALSVASSAWSAPQPSAPATPREKRVAYCLNTSTIREQGLTLAEEVELAAQAGYQGIEPWIREIQQYQRDGGNLSDLRKRIEDLGLQVPSAIGFANWIVDDDSRRREGLDSARRDMELVRAIGGTRIAAPPAGATRQTDMNLLDAAARYRALLEVGKDVGVTPQLELWGFSTTLSRLGELMFVATESAHPDACVLPDVYHIYKGGSDFQGLRLVNGHAVHVFHMNDYPADPPRDRIGDAQRVYPGDGVAPITDILRVLLAGGFAGMLSLELFNPEYWKQDAMHVARTGIEKMKACVEAA